MALEGKFVLASNDNYESFLKAVGIPADRITRMVAAKPVLVVAKTGDGMTVKTIAGDKEFSNTVVFGKDSEADLAGIKYIVNVNPTANGYSGTMALGGKKGSVTVVADGNGFTQTTVVDGVTAKRTYTRQ